MILNPQSTLKCFPNEVPSPGQSFEPWGWSGTHNDILNLLHPSARLLGSHPVGSRYGLPALSYIFWYWNE